MRHIFSVIALVIFGVSTAIAASSPPVDVENVLDPTRHPYQQYGTANCPAAGNCSITLPAITAEIVLITHVSCDFTLATGGSFVVASLGSKNANPAFFFSASHTADGTVTEYIINAGTYLFVSQTDLPIIDVVSIGTPVQGLVCTATGYYR
jgi:hypothetical protein